MSKPTTPGHGERTLRRAPAPVRVAVADAREPMLRGLADMVNNVPGFRAAVLVHDGAALLRACTAKRPPEAVLLQAALDDGRGVQTMALLHRAWPRLPVLLLCEQPDAPLAQRAVGAGAAGLLCTVLEVQALGTALREAHGVGFHMNAVLRTHLGMHRVDTLRGKHHRPHGLTTRELQVIHLCADPARYTHGEVADRLGVEPSTITSHLKNIRAKWKMRSTGAAVRHAVRNGWAGGGLLSRSEPLHVSRNP